MTDDDAVKLYCLIAEYAKELDTPDATMSVIAMADDLMDSLPNDAIPAWARIRVKETFGG